MSTPRTAPIAVSTNRRRIATLGRAGLAASVPLIAAALTACAIPATTDTADMGQATTRGLPARVVAVLDGDTVIVRGVQVASDGTAGAGTAGVEHEYTVRMLGIDAPEMHAHAQTDPDCGAVRATDRLAALLPKGTRVRVVADVNSDAVDRFGRSLGYIVKSRTDLNRKLVAEGLVEAWYPRGEPAPGRFAEYRELQRKAQTRERGSWASCDTLGR